jgi:hypothetical protein
VRLTLASADFLLESPVEFSRSGQTSSLRVDGDVDRHSVISTSWTEPARDCSDLAELLLRRVALDLDFTLWLW